jgi:glycosyltransferase involved in cell wall biosynthesis
MAKIVINGRFLTQKITGVQRFSIEIVKELDKIIDKDNEYILVCPKKSKVVNNVDFENIKLESYGNFNGHIWEQIDLPKFVKTKKATLLNLYGAVPIFNPGIAVIHDISFIVNPKFFSWRFRQFNKLMIRSIIKRSPFLFTVSEFTKSEILRFFHFDGNKIFVIGSGYEHIERIESDFSILERLKLKPKNFYLTVATLAPNKNLSFILNVAKMNSNKIFVIVGSRDPKLSKVFGSSKMKNVELKNVIYTGYIDDFQMKALYQYAEAFIFPSFYEGFGLPPLEALVCGTNIIVSNTTALSEIYKDVAFFIDPRDVSTLDKLIKNDSIFNDEPDKNKIEELKSKYNWKNIALKIKQVIDSQLYEVENTK